MRIMTPIISGVLYICIMTAAIGTTYYVSPAGNDAAAGTDTALAFRTAAHAAGLVTAGDSVRIMAGTYTDQVVPAVSGTPDAPIVFKAHGDGEAVFTTSPSDFSFELIGKNWIIIDGVTCRNAYGWVQIENGSFHNIVKNCTFDGSGNYHCLKIMNSSYNTISHCTFLRARDGALDVDLADYIGLWENCHYNLIEYCTFGRITHNAFTELQYNSPYTPSHNMVRYCTFKDLGHRGTESGGSNHTIIEKSYFTGMAGEMIRLSGKRILVRDNLLTHNIPEPTGSVPEWDCMIIYRSHQNEYGNLADTRHTRVYNNTFYDCTNDYSIVVRPFKLMKDNIIMNNIFYKNNNLLYRITPRETEDKDYLFTNNILQDRTVGENMVRHSGSYYTFSQAHSSLTNYYQDNWETDPAFADENNDDFHLTSGSPAVNTGRALTLTRNAGSGTQVPVDDVIWFSDGYGLVGGDEIMVGSSGPVVITGIGYTNNIIAVDQDITWNDNDPITRPYSGSGPDLGVFEYGMSNMRVVSPRLARGRTGHYYFSHLDAWEGTRPYTWALTSGSLPGGLQLYDNGEISGVPAAAGEFSFTVTVTDSANGQASREVSLEILEGTFYSTTLEAEDGTDNGPYETGSDAGASGGEYIYIPAGTGRTSFPDPEMAYTVQAPASGLYYVWLRMYGFSGGQRKAYVFVNADSCRRFNPTVYNQYFWVKSSDEPFALNYGDNSLQLGHGDELVRIDRILVTQDRYYDPNTSGIPEPYLVPTMPGGLNIPNPVRDLNKLENCQVYSLTGKRENKFAINRGVYYITVDGINYYKRLIIK